MKAKYLASLLMQHPEFEVEFTAILPAEGEYPEYLHFNNIDIADVGHSDKAIKLTGHEK